MDWWLKTGTMKRKLNEKASDTDKEKVQRRDGSAARGHHPAAELYSQRFFLPLRRHQDDNYILCCLTLDNDNS